MFGQPTRIAQCEGDEQRRLVGFSYIAKRRRPCMVGTSTRPCHLQRRAKAARCLQLPCKGACRPLVVGTSTRPREDVRAVYSYQPRRVYTPLCKGAGANEPPLLVSFTPSTAPSLPCVKMAGPCTRTNHARSKRPFARELEPTSRLCSSPSHPAPPLPCEIHPAESIFELPREPKGRLASQPGWHNMKETSKCGSLTPAPLQRDV